MYSNCGFSLAVKHAVVHSACGQWCHRLVDGANVLGRSAATTAHDVDQTLLGKFLDQAAGHFGRFVKAGFTHGVGQARVGVAADESVGCGAVELLNIGAHQGRT